MLLLDEPFGALDARSARSSATWLRRLHDEVHVTTVFVTHDQEEALEVADQIVVINDGRIEQIGSPDELYDTPASEFVMTSSAPSRCWTADWSARTTSKWSPSHSRLLRRTDRPVKPCGLRSPTGGGPGRGG